MERAFIALDRIRMGRSVQPCCDCGAELLQKLMTQQWFSTSMILQYVPEEQLAALIGALHGAAQKQLPSP